MIQRKLILKRFNKREYKKKKTAVLKRNNKNRDIQREIATIYSSKTYKAIKDYLEEGKYPDEVLSIIPYEARKQRKRGFRQIIDKDKRYKLIPSKVNRNSNDLLRNWNWRQKKYKRKKRKDDQEVYLQIEKIALKTGIFYLKYGKLKRSYMMLT